MGGAGEHIENRIAETLPNDASAGDRAMTIVQGGE